MTENELLDRLQLIRSENVGPVTFRRLMERFNTAARALDALPMLAAKGGARAPKIADRKAVETEYAAIRKAGVTLLCWGEAEYPALLAQIDDAPPILMAKGNVALLHKPTVAIVGARNASLNARNFTQKLARDLGAAGYVMVSGVARGIDGAAHGGSLATGTVGVPGGGVDIVYPEEHRELYAQIAEQGVIVSECPLGYTPMARDFPRRNRIISGLSRGVVVVEAAHQSGSLITARMAAEQGREVFAVPGSPMDPRCQGTNNLLREGATLVESATDVLRELQTMKLATPPANSLTPPFTAPDEGDLSGARPQILELLSPTPVTVDALIRDSELPVAVVQTVILELELAGRVARSAGGQVALLADTDLQMEA